MLHQRDGYLTRDLRRTPGGFGLGRVPAKLQPDATTDMVCGYCSTGCSLTVHLRDGEAVSLTPAVDYPVNRGVACPKGWEALAVLGAGDRATTPLRRDAAGVQRPVEWDTALRTMVERFKAIQAQHGPESVAFLSTGQMPTEEMALLGALAKFGMGMAHGGWPRRPVSARRSSSGLRRRFTAARGCRSGGRWASTRAIRGVRTAQSIINLALMTGNMGRPGTGANSITGRCNAMGSRLFSNTTNLLGGHDFANPDHREKVARVLDVDPGVIPTRASWAYNEIIEGILRERIKGLWVVCTNTAHSWINQDQARDVLGRLDCLVVQDMYATTETARMADLVLPAAGWGEGQSPAATFQILKRLSAGQPCDITGIDVYDMLDERGGIQWPCPAGESAEAGRTERRLFEDGRYYHPDGRARFLYEDPRPLPEPPNDRFPLLLLTGRGSAAQWHTQTRTAKSAVLRKLYPAEVYVEVNPLDARARGIGGNDAVHVESRRGRITATAFVTRSVRPGQVFVPMHYEATNRLTDGVFDPYSKQPSYKACAVELRPVAAVG